MKIYRVIPDTFLTGSRLSSRELTGIEDIYYRMGYTSFLGRYGFHEFNNISEKITEEGKYFYLFLEDAILEGHQLIGGYHHLRMDTFSLVEYDVPEDLILNKLGYGDYTFDITPKFLLETFIQKSDLGESISNTNLSNEEKEVGLLKSFQESLRSLQEVRFSSLSDMFYYKELFCNDKLEDVVDNQERLKDLLVSSSLYRLFLQEKGDIVKSPYITGKIIPVNLRYLERTYGNWNKVSEYFQDEGFQCDFSEEQEEFKKELLSQVRQKEVDSEKVKTLLKSKSYI